MGFSMKLMDKLKSKFTEESVHYLVMINRNIFKNLYRSCDYTSFYLSK